MTGFIVLTSYVDIISLYLLIMGTIFLCALMIVVRIG